MYTIINVKLIVVAIVLAYLPRGLDIFLYAIRFNLCYKIQPLVWIEQNCMMMLPTYLYSCFFIISLIGESTSVIRWTPNHDCSIYKNLHWYFHKKISKPNILQLIFNINLVIKVVCMFFLEYITRSFQPTVSVRLDHFWSVYNIIFVLFWITWTCI